jgi:preprotein translocase subunit SecA
VSASELLASLEAIVPLLAQLGPQMQRRTDAELRALTTAYRERAGNGETLDSLLPEAFALVGEATARTLGERHSDVQLLAGAALHHGTMVEIRHGRTPRALATTLPAYLNALAGAGVHVVTINDDLAERHAERMGAVYRFLGLEVGVILEQRPLPLVQRRASYQADITYGSYKEFGFDYLRDNLALSTSEVVQRGHAVAFVDDPDAILIGEARTPLCLFGPSQVAQAGREREVWATISVRAYYRRYGKLAGMSGTAAGQAAEFQHSYQRQAVKIPTGEPAAGTARTTMIGGVRQRLAKWLLESERRRTQALRREQHRRAVAFDEVLEQQCEAVYTTRRRVLESHSDDLQEQIVGMLCDVVERAVAQHCPPGARRTAWNLDGLLTTLSGVYPIGIGGEAIDPATCDPTGLRRLLAGDAGRAVNARRAELGAEVFEQLARAVLLNRLDHHWREHLREMDSLSGRIQRRSTGKGDRLGDYRREASRLLQQRQQLLARDTLGYVFNARIEVADSG